MNINVDWEKLDKYLTGQCSEKDKIDFEYWLMADKDHQSFFEIYSKAWNRSKENETEVEKQKGINIFGTSNKSVNINFIRTVRALTITAVILLSLSLIVISYSIYRKNKVNYEEFVYAYSKDKIKNIRLKDGTKICLNKNSLLIYDKHFRHKERIVILSGEAYFEIHRNPSQPFKIFAGGTITRIKGTKFYLSTREATNFVTLKVIYGKVRFFSQNYTQTEFILTKDIEAQINSSTGEGNFINTYHPNFHLW